MEFAEAGLAFIDPRSPDKAVYVVVRESDDRDDSGIFPSVKRPV